MKQQKTYTGIIAMGVADHSSGTARTLLLVFLAFSILYSITIAAAPYITTGRIGVAALIAWALLERKNPFLLLKDKILLIFIPVPYVAIQYLIVGDFNQLSRFAHLFVYSFAGAAAFSCLVKNTRDALNILTLAITLQSMFIFFSFVSLEFRAWVSIYTLTDSNIDFTSYLYRAPGLSGTSGASLSLIQSMGFFSGMLLLSNKSYNNWHKSLYLIFAMLCAASCVMVGRTGILVSIIFFIYFSAYQKTLISREAINSIPAVIFLFFVFFAIKGSLDDSFSGDFFATWVFGFFTGSDGTITAIQSMPIPPISLETFYGTGLSSLAGGANPSGHDSGFIQAYYSMGLPFSVIFYLTYLAVLVWVTKWYPPPLKMVVVVCFFILEFKEPFIFKYSSLFVLLTLYFSIIMTGHPQKKSIFN